ncbi:sensor histidine kinase [Nonomuraea sp. NPDC051191]|uniref:sensor histidine kinase n=1 Tax=Nonomuraea sp. NPDC051191 TaxID=3364372 RepID=UPI0037B74EA3
MSQVIGRLLAQVRTPTADAALATLVGLPLLGWTWVVLTITPGPSPVAFAGALLAHSAMALRRTAPLASFGAVAAGCAAMLAGAGGLLLPPSMLVFPWSLYSMCAYGSRRALGWGPVAALLGSAVVGLRFWLNPREASGLPPAFVFLFLLAVTMMMWSFGLWRRTQRAYLESLEDRARRAEADREERARRAVHDERARIAREIHDVVSHSLSVVISQAQGGTYAVRTDPDRAAGILTTIADAGRHALADMRGLLGLLRAETPLESESAGSAPTLAELPRLLEGTRAAGLAVTFRQDGAERRLSPAAELAVYRLVQESLTNTLKHGGAGRRAQVVLSWGSAGLAVQVQDDGPRDSHPPGGGTGLGLVGMRERFQAFGGTVAAGPATTGGFHVSARLPYLQRTEQT